MRYRGRRWNNILMLSVIAFIGVLNLPTLIKTYLIEPEPELQASSPYPYLLNPTAELQALHFTKWSVVQEDGHWVYQIKESVSEQSVSAQELSQRWQQLVGTEVDSQTYTDLTPQLNTPHTIEVWYQDQEEPQRITYYQLPEFWLLKNWNDQWLAVSIEESYLFPSFGSDQSFKSDLSFKSDKLSISDKPPKSDD
ncbi:hypothetical protein BCT70_016085 [Vibrio lentus]|nr:hypothetical protein [Vibrio lentus]MCB5447589.1 hypothetical protein [Vibrio lentus]MCB5464212.1 hypothetical protein [Vibrio lentus]MCC5485653.1 hypothetical protein [Vibrio lentus]MCC5486398.1 hypothetical protein [Vibrio lentus]